MTGTPGVSPALGAWSIILAILSPLVLVIGGVTTLFALLPSGAASQVESAYIPLRVAQGVTVAVAVAMLVAALGLGIGSIARTWPKTGPGRTSGIVLGSIGVGLCALIGLFYLWALTDVL